MSDNNYKFNKGRPYILIDIVLIYAIGRGGLENVISKVYKGLVKKGHRVRVFQAYRPEYIEW